MANDKEKNPFTIDSVGTIEATRKIFINKAEWYAPTTLGHTLTFTDGNDREIWTGSAQNVGANTRGILELFGEFTGLKCSVIDSGEVKIYFEWR